MTRWTLPPDEIPSAWFNVAPHLTVPLQPPLHPVTRQPVCPDDLAPLFPAALIEQEMAIAPWIDEALAGEEKVILFNYCGHGFLDLSAYDDYLHGRLPDE